MNVTIRPATKGDLPAIAKLAANLVREHHATDAKRFLLVEPVENGYTWFFSRELEAKDAVILAAVTDDDRVVGYCYGRLEERDWNALLDAHGGLHDVYVDASARRSHVAEKLVGAMCDRLKDLGAPRTVLMTMTSNVAAQKLFAKLGFRTTMLEMTREST
jgi:ribosomal protein S18 acetylase RimI-like enzyme